MPLKVVHTCDLIKCVNRNYVVVQIKMKRKLRTQGSYRAFRITWRFLSKPSSYENTLSNFYLFTIVSTSGGKTLQVP